jgi:heme exporter protein C
LSTWLRNSQTAVLAVGVAIGMAVALVLVFFVAPVDADQGLSQKIFYFHVPIALTAYVCFGVGAWKGLRLLWTGNDRYDLESYTAVHQGTIFGLMTLITGSIWAKASWGRWWTWSSNQLVLFLVLFLFYCAYFMLRFSVDPGPARARISAVYALFGVVLVPVSFLAIRLANDFIHPTVFTRHGPQMTGWMFTAFLAAWATFVLLAGLMYRLELAGKRVDVHLRTLREALL